MLKLPTSLIRLSPSHIEFNFNFHSVCWFSSIRDNKSRNVDLYYLLGVKYGCEHIEIKNAYYSLAKRLHPDMQEWKVSDSSVKHLKDSFSRISAAYEVG
jgi:DnaJ-domain-containing protein 1